MKLEKKSKTKFLQAFFNLKSYKIEKIPTRNKNIILVSDLKNSEIGFIYKKKTTKWKILTWSFLFQKMTQKDQTLDYLRQTS